jgi:hypothetical protein
MTSKKDDLKGRVIDVILRLGPVMLEYVLKIPARHGY